MNDFSLGWYHFWYTFTRSWLFVAGFAVASVLSTVAYEIVKAVVLALWR